MAIKKIKKYKWEYIFDDSIRNGLLKVIPYKKDKRPTPKSLYKYYSLTDNSICAITKQYLYGSQPYQLNDIYDCDESLIRYDDINFINNFLKGIFSEEEIEMKLNAKDKSFEKIIQYNINIIMYSRVGLLSFTEDPISIPMWSYYTLNKGFVVEFDYSKFDFVNHGPFQINYQKKLEPISANKEMILSFLFQSNVKTKNWEHEKEWRILAEKYKTMDMQGIEIPNNIKPENREFKYDTSAIKRIILGHRFFNQNDKELIANKDGNLEIVLKSNKDFDLKRKLLEFIKINNSIPIYIIGKDYSKFHLTMLPFNNVREAILF